MPGQIWTNASQTREQLDAAVARGQMTYDQYRAAVLALDAADALPATDAIPTTAPAAATVPSPPPWALPDTLDRALERLRQTRAAHQAEIDSSSATPADRALRGSTVLDVGARVFDPVTGQEGIVYGRTRENVVVPAPARGNR